MALPFISEWMSLLFIAIAFLFVTWFRSKAVVVSDLWTFPREALPKRISFWTKALAILWLFVYLTVQNIAIRLGGTAFLFLLAAILDMIRVDMDLKALSEEDEITILEKNRKD